MRIFFTIYILSLTFSCNLHAQSVLLSKPIIDDLVVFESKDGIINVEAEHFYKQTKNTIRQWYRVSQNETKLESNVDSTNYLWAASNKSFVEVLPDERKTHDDKLIHGENFSDIPGKSAIMHYKVKVNNPGRYYVWVRALSTGSEDNSIHVGINGSWPTNGQRMQWCEGKNQWTWASKQRTKEVHCGIPHEIYLDIERPGIHDIQFSMREDGFKFDKFLLTTDRDFIPTAEGLLPISSKEKFLPPANKSTVLLHDASYFDRVEAANPKNKAIRAQQFDITNTKFYKEGKRWLAVNPKLYEEAETSTVFTFESGRYDLIFIGVGESDGGSYYKITINDKEIINYQAPISTEVFEEGKNFNALVRKIYLMKGDTIKVTARIGSTDGKEHARARWAGIIFAPVGKGKKIQNAPSSYTSK
jgi:hypothetical protein